jgi:hypothetical protein
MMGERRISGFFYGLFMDEVILRDSGANPQNARQAYVDHFQLRIGNRATLVPSSGARAYGMIIDLTHSELDRLYGAPGLDQYRPEAVLARIMTGGETPALCFNLRSAPEPGERNASYAAKLQEVLRRLQFPSDYVDSIASR